MPKKIIVVLFGLVLICSACFAETSEWKDPNFDFKAIKTVLVLNPVVARGVQDNFAAQKATTMLHAAIKENQKKTSISFVPLQTIINVIGVEIGVDLNALRKSDTKKYAELMALHGPKHYDAMLASEVVSLGYGKFRREGSFSSFTTSQTDTYYVNGSMYDVEGPRTNFKFRPPHDVTVVNGGITLSLISAQSGNLIWGITDIRDRTNKKLSSTSPDGMLERIINASIDKLMDKVISPK